MYVSRRVEELLYKVPYVSVIAFPKNNVDDIKCVVKDHFAKFNKLDEIKSIFPLYTECKNINALQFIDTKGGEIIDDIKKECKAVVADGLVSIKSTKALKTDETRTITEIREHLKVPYNIGGKGVKIGIIDTGVTKLHPMLISKFFEVKRSNHFPDINGHGTWCSTASAGIFRHYVGIAYEADLVVVKSLSDILGISTFSRLVKGLDVCINNRPDVISMSFGAKPCDTIYDDPFYYAMSYLRSEHPDIICVAAAGNDGSKKIDGKYGSINTPGALPTDLVITVGAWDEINHKLAYFSSRGPSKYGYVKPDIVEPGVNIISGTFGLLDILTDGKPNLFSPLSGTSMATPIAAGLFAIAKSICNQVGEEYIHEDAVKTIDSIPIEKNNEIGKGLLTFDTIKEYLETEKGIKIKN